MTGNNQIQVYTLPDNFFLTQVRFPTPRRYNGKRAWKARGKQAR